MQISSKLLAIATSIFVVFSASGCSTQSESNQIPEKLTFAAIPVDGKILPGDSYALAVQILEDKLRIPIEFTPVNDQIALTQSAMAGKTDLIVVDGLTYTLATKDENKLELLGVMARSPEGTPGSFNYGLTTKDHPEIKSLADLKNKTVCFNGPTGNGYLFASVALKKLGLSTDAETTKDMKIVYTGGSLETAIALKHGDCDAAVIVDTYYDILLPAGGIIEKNEFNKFWTSDRVPAYTFAASSKLPKSLIDKIREILVTEVNKTSMVEKKLCESEETCTFLSPNNWGYLPVDNSYYDQVRQMCRDLGFARCE